MHEAQDDELLDHFPLDEAETRQEAASLLFSDSESDSEFEGFNDSDLDSSFYLVTVVVRNGWLVRWLITCQLIKLITSAN